jgi:methylphosphotriester-DNA--protein-cysteine methyltransferase
VVKTFRPHPLLRNRIAAIDVVENEGGEASVLPSSGAVLGFQFRGRVQAGEGLLAPAGITGIQQSSKTYRYVGSTGSVLVRFTPQGAACLGVPASELAGCSIALDAFLAPARVAEACECLADAFDPAARVAIVERFLMALPYAGDPLVTSAIELLDAGYDDAKVAAVARSLGTSERQLERRFLARVGVTPKRFAILRRFERALARVANAPSLSAAALDAGYYDQSHFIRDCRRFAGVAPGELLVSRR